MTRFFGATVVAALGVALVVGPLSGCGGGCGGGGQAASILERLPAGIDGVGVVSVKSILDEGAIAKIEEQIFKNGGDKVPAEAKGMLAAIEHIAVIGAGPGEAKEGGDCEAAADHAMKVLAKEMAGAEVPKSMREEMVKQCKRDPSVADCMLAAEDMKGFMKCEPGYSRRPQMKVAVVLIGAGVEPGLAKIAEAMKVKAGEGVPKWKIKKGGAHPLGDGAVAFSDDVEMLKTLVASWEGKGDRLDKNAKLWGWLSKVDKGADFVAAMVPPEAPPMVTGGAVSMKLGGSFATKTYLAGDAQLEAMARQGLAAAKLGMAMVTPDQLGEMTSKVPIPKEQLDALVKGVKELVESVEIESAEGGILVTAKADIDVRELVALGAEMSEQAFGKYMKRAKRSEERLKKKAAEREDSETGEE